jgi:hypothetical protein
MSSSAGESHPHALTEPDVNLSIHPALIIQPQVERLSANAEIARAPSVQSALTSIPHVVDDAATYDFALFKDSSHPLVDLQIKLDNSPPSLHLRYRDFITTTG